MQYIKGRQDKESSNNYEYVIVPQIRFNKCPIKTSLGVLGKKWTMLIIRDIGVYKITRFNRLLESIAGITPTVLSMRFKELEKKGFTKWYSDVVFEDKMPRKLTEIFPHPQAREIIMDTA